MYCRFCGCQILDDSKYCTYCGRQLSKVESEYHYTRDEMKGNTTDNTKHINSSESSRNNQKKRSAFPTSIILTVVSVLFGLFVIVMIITSLGSSSVTSSSTASVNSTLTPKTTIAPTPSPSVISSLPLPKTGTIFYGDNLERLSEITINGSSGDSYYVKLKDSSLRDVFAFFVRAGDSVTMNVPTGMYYFYYASGDYWYGEDLLFGEKTMYAKDDDLLDFSTYTWTYTLYPVTNGNFTETLINPDEF